MRCTVHQEDSKKYSAFPDGSLVLPSAFCETKYLFTNRQRFPLTRCDKLCAVCYTVSVKAWGCMKCRFNIIFAR